MNPTTFSALAEPHRFHIVELLRDKPRPVNEIVDRLHLNQPQVSKHLKVLADAGIVEVKPLAQQRYYQINTKTIQKIEDWAHTLNKLWNKRFDRLEKLLKNEQRKVVKHK